MISAREAAFEFKKDLIVKAAAENFFEKGYTGTKIDDIAAALKVTKPFIYYHFSSKLEILEEICGRTSGFAAELAESAAKHRGDLLIVDRFRHFVRAYSRTVIDEQRYLSIYFRESKHLPKQSRDRFHNDRRRFHVALSHLLQEGRDSGDFSFTDLSVTGQTVTGMITWIFNWYQSDGNRSAEQIGRIIEDLVLAAVGCKAHRAQDPVRTFIVPVKQPAVVRKKRASAK